MPPRKKKTNIRPAAKRKLEQLALDKEKSDPNEEAET